MNHTPPNEAIPQKLVLTNQVLEAIKQTIGSRPAECGGILGTDDTGIITSYYFDETGTGTEDSYEPDVETINSILTNEWLPKGIQMVGIVHSHANGHDVPSCGDIHYGMRILQSLDEQEKFYLPIVTQTDGCVKLTAYALENNEAFGTVCRKQEWETISL